MNKISNFPIMFYAVVMGLGGLCVAYESLNKLLKLSQSVGFVLNAFTSLIFAFISFIYVIKIIKFPNEVRAELNHPIKINFFAAFAISLLLLAIVFKNNASAHFGLFYTGLVAQTFMSFYVVASWINRNLEIKHSNPAWFIPIVGNLLVITAAQGKDSYLWFYFSFALFFYIVLFSIIFYRILFCDQLPAKFMPTLFIFIAPPSVAFIDYIKLTGNFNEFSMFLLSLAIFFGILVLFMYKNFLKLKFFLSWWAFTFPTAALCIALVKAYELTEHKGFLWGGLAAFSGLCALIIIVAFYTIKSIKNNDICVE